MRGLIVAVLLLLAGCAEPPAEAEDGLSPTSGFLDAQSSDTTGGITGVVVNENIQPLAGATVTLLIRNETATSDAEGRFSFELLEPGTYFLDVQAPRHLPTQISAQVLAGDTSKLRVSLLSDGLPDPFFVTNHFQGRITFHATVAWAALEWELDTRFGLQTPGCSECVFTFESDEIADGHVFEATWEESLDDPRGASELYWSYAVVEPYQELFGYAGAPIYKTWGADAYETPASPYKVMLLGDYDGAQVDQTFEIFLTQWFNAQAPDGWSIVQGTA